MSEWKVTTNAWVYQKDKNIYHYITRDKGCFVINECLPINRPK